MIDYHDFTTIDTPKANREQKNVGDIWINQIKCLKCGDTPRSQNRHDYRTCECGAVSVDGGSCYAKRSGDLTLYEEQSILFKDIQQEED